MLPKLWADARYAARSLSRSPAFAVPAVLTVALGVGVNTAIFTVVNGVLFRDLTVPDAHELVSVYQAVDGVPNRESTDGFPFTTAEYRAYRDRTETLSSIMGFSGPWGTTLGGEVPQDVVGALVTCNYFDVLRQPPAIGRGLTAQDCETGADPVVVLSHGLWTTTFAAAPDIVGRTVELNRQAFSVVGVAPEDMHAGAVDRTAYFAPISTQPLLLPEENIYENDQNSWLVLIGRREDQAGLDQVRAELEVIAAQIDQQQPGRSTTLLVERATPLSHLPAFRRTAFAVGAIVMTAFGLVLLIACANVANLLLARATARSREITVRFSLGASRARVIQQLLTESLAISIAGGALGAVLALWSFQAIGAFGLPSLPIIGMPRGLDASPDARALSFTLVLIFGTGILFGLAPALHLSKQDLHTAIKQDSSGTGRRLGGLLQNALVGVQVALCMVLVIGAGLLLRGLHATQTVDPGFVYRDIAVAAFDLEAAGYGTGGAAAFRQQLLEQAGGLPGVATVAYARREPLSTQRTGAMIRLPGQAESQARRAERNEVTPDYFSLVGIPIVRGRTFTDAEVADDALVAIVTETTARNLWPGQEPIGQTLLAGNGFAFRVIGLARDAQVTRFGDIDPYYLYLPAAPRVATGQLELLVRSRADFNSTASGIRAAVRSLDPGVAVRVSPLEANLEYWRNLSGSVTALGAALGMLALVLATLGIYGVVSYFVSRRYREIGIRMALGARSGDVLRLVLRQTMRPVVVGAGLGIATAVGASSILSSVLFGVSRVDPVGLGGAAVFVLGVALAAGVLAGRPVIGSDPMGTLRYE